MRILMERASLAALLVAVFPVASAFAQSDDARPKQIILMIADGWCYNHITATNYYQHGEAGKQVYEGFAHYPMATYAYDGEYKPRRAASRFRYVLKGPNDSAATATAMASGVATYKGAIGVDQNREPLRLISALAEEQGKATGVVSSVNFNHATPAAFLAHNESRGNYGEIARAMLAESTADVILGGGHPFYDSDGRHKSLPSEGDLENFGGKRLWEGLQKGTLGADANGDGTADPWAFLDTTVGLKALAHGETPARVFGLAPVASTLQQDRGHAQGIGEEAEPFATELTPNMPTLTDLSLGALNVLDEDPDGFFLMIEGGAVDWASHANQSDRMIEELTDFNAAVSAVVTWIEEHSTWDDTLLLITGDHETGYLTGPGSDPDMKPIENRGKGNLPGMEWHSGGHSNQLIPLYAKGAGANAFTEHYEGKDPNRGRYIHDTAIGKVMFEVLR
jgi:alkaline phosphatase